MFEECAPPIIVAILIGRSGFGDAFVSVEDDDSDDIQNITFLGSCWKWNDAAVCGDRIRLNVVESRVFYPLSCIYKSKDV